MSPTFFGELIRKYGLLAVMILGYVVSYEITSGDPDFRAILHKSLDVIYDLKLGVQLLALS